MIHPNMRSLSVVGCSEIIEDSSTRLHIRCLHCGRILNVPILNQEMSEGYEARTITFIGDDILKKVKQWNNHHEICNRFKE